MNFILQAALHDLKLIVACFVNIFYYYKLYW